MKAVPKDFPKFQRQENTCARVSFLKMLLYERDFVTGCFPVNLARFLSTAFPKKRLRWLLLYCFDGTLLTEE